MPSRGEFIGLTLAILGSRFLPALGSVAHAQEHQKPDEANLNPQQALEVNIFDILMSSIISERDSRRASMPEAILNSADETLNARRVNFLLFGYGETHEPPRTMRDEIGSLSVLSYHLDRKSYDLVSITHDTRAPEAERYLESQGQPVENAIKMGHIYQWGGLDLVKQVGVNFTGLIPDFSLYLPDEAIARFIDDVPTSVTVDVPKQFTVNGYIFKGVLKPEHRTYQAGPVDLSGEEVLQFIKTVPVENVEQYDKSLEHNARKALVARGLLKTLNSRISEVSFWGRAFRYLYSGSHITDGVTYDFDPIALFGRSVVAIPTELAKAKLQGKNVIATMPEVAESLYIVDGQHGDGGVMWVELDKNPITERDRNRGFYTDKFMEIPIDADPYADNLAEGYWGSTRRLVAATLK